MAPGDTFSFSGNPRLDSRTQFYVDGTRVETLHTSCSKPIYVGMVFGDFEITAGESYKNGPLCNGPPIDDDERVVGAPPAVISKSPNTMPT